jgi:hypothetical protein
LNRLFYASPQVPANIAIGLWFKRRKSPARSPLRTGLSLLMAVGHADSQTANNFMLNYSGVCFDLEIATTASLNCFAMYVPQTRKYAKKV